MTFPERYNNPDEKSFALKYLTELVIASDNVMVNKKFDQFFMFWRGLLTFLKLPSFYHVQEDAFVQNLVVIGRKKTLQKYDITNISNFEKSHSSLIQCILQYNVFGSNLQLA